MADGFCLATDGNWYKTVKDVIFGISNENNDKMLDIFNFCILLAKDFIYNCKINKKNPNVKEYKSKFVFRLEIEKHLATANDKLEDFQNTWEMFSM